ncbi:hypothetical protein HGM15179_011631 [Zosterops borbonicus]|uniref:Uncharacterized protein n=1 Tax=Zosterops borbonicus TaxID=364589 RepID=A0A8K1GB84_9PASS|nr:hypothetical protein HGM15179_011631 [Zosterops borbonicus]
MGSRLSQQLCCVPCERCREQEAANTEPGETKPILQSPRDTGTFLDTQPSSPALKVPSQGSKELGQERQRSAEALEENGEPCCAAEGWEPAWNPMDFFMAPADEEGEGEVEDSTLQQEKVGKAEEEMKPVPGVPVGAELVAEEEQPGPEGALCAGITLQEGNLSPTELPGEAEPGQGCETEPPTGILLGSDLVLCAMQVAGQPGGAQTSPQPAQRAELTCLVQAMSVLTLQSPNKVMARGVAELCSVSPVSWEPLCPQWGSLEPPNHLLELSKKGREGTVSPAQGLQGTVCLQDSLSLAQGTVSLAQGVQDNVSPAQDLQDSVSPAQGLSPAQDLQGTVSPAQGLQGTVCLQDSVSPAQGTVSLAQDLQDSVSPAQGTVSPAGLSKILQQPQDGALCGSRGCPPRAEAELQNGIVQAALELPEEPAGFVPVPEFPPVAPSLPEGFGGSGEVKAENAGV